MEDTKNLPTEIQQVDMPVTSMFSDGVYIRTIFMPKGTIVIGKKHKTRHFNIVLTGDAEVWINGEHKNIKAPTIFESLENVRKVLYINEDMYWSTVHATELKDEDEIEKMIIEEETLTSIEDINNKLKLYLEEIK